MNYYGRGSEEEVNYNRDIVSEPVAGEERQTKPIIQVLEPPKTTSDQNDEAAAGGGGGDDDDDLDDFFASLS